MKKLIVLIFALSILLALQLSVSAEEPVADDAITSAENAEASDKAIDYEKIASEVYEKIRADLPGGLAQNIAELIAQWESTEKENATLADRIKEFFDTENLVSTVSMLFMVFVGLAVYAMKKKQALQIKNTNCDLLELKKQTNEQLQNERNLDGNVLALIAAMEQISKIVAKMDERLSASDSAAEQAKRASVGVATMLRDIFNNSKTIDEAGKKIMNLDYLKAVEPSETLKEKEEV